MPVSPYFTIPAGQPFAKDLAKGVLDLCPNPVLLSQAIILLPSQRTVKTVRDAFLDILDGKAALLPQMRALGDLDAETASFMHLSNGAPSHIPPSIPPLERQLLLAEQIRKFPIGGDLPSAAQALALAESLASLIDQLHGAGTSLSALADILPDDLAQHWQDIHKFLDIVMHYWPQMLSARGQIDPADRAMRLLRLQIEIWREAPPDGLVILAGSTGSLQGTREMMKCISKLPQGMIVFPGLDTDDEADDSSLEPISKSPTHPLSMLADTLSAIGCNLSEVRLWPGCASDEIHHKRPVRSFLTELFRPAEQTAKWRRLRELNPEIDYRAVQGLNRITLASNHEEAALIASLMRETLEDVGKTAMLVTPDRGLAQLVMAALSRWGIEVDDSAGQPLSETSPGRFLLLLAELPAADSPAQALLNLLKHPLSCSGLPRGQFLAQLRAVELTALRGVLTDRRLEGIADRLAEAPKLLTFYKTHIEAVIAPLLTAGNGLESLPKRAGILAEVAEKLAANDTDPSGALRLYEGPAGTALAEFLAELGDCDTVFYTENDTLAATLRGLTSRVSVRFAHKKHPRLAILGSVESRMQQADRLILSGLNEGVWPPARGQDFWMNAAARKALNLPNQYWRAGLAAHDFFMAAGQNEVFLTRANRQDDTPTRPSRILSRLQAVLEATQLEGYVKDEIPPSMRACLDADKKGIVAPISAPAPKPPAGKRPRKFSATEFDKWITDPYAIYAKHVLGLHKLEPIDDVPGAALRGTIIHNLLADLAKETPNPDAQLETIKRNWSGQPVIGQYWSIRMRALVDWFTQRHAEQSADIDALLIEERGEITLDLPFGQYKISARADRIEQLSDGSLKIIDFKTGETPRKSKVASMRKTQMLVEALILAYGGFKGIQTGGTIKGLEYWHVTGRPEMPGKINSVLPDEFDVEDIRARLSALFEMFSDESMPYLSEPNFRAKPDFSDVRHLARVREWRATEVEDD